MYRKVMMRRVIVMFLVSFYPGLPTLILPYLIYYCPVHICNYYFSWATWELAALIMPFPLLYFCVYFLRSTIFPYRTRASNPVRIAIHFPVSLIVPVIPFRPLPWDRILFILFSHPLIWNSFSAFQDMEIFDKCKAVIIQNISAFEFG